MRWRYSVQVLTPDLPDTRGDSAVVLGQSLFEQHGEGQEPTRGAGASFSGADISVLQRDRYDECITLRTAPERVVATHYARRTDLN